MQKLPNTYIGAYGQIMQQVKRNDFVAMYKDTKDDYYEVFKIFTKKGGRKLQSGFVEIDREIIPPASYFGDRLAFCPYGIKRAELIYSLINEQMVENNCKPPLYNTFLQTLSEALKQLK